MQRRQIDRLLGLAAEHLGGALQKLPLPLRDLVGVQRLSWAISASAASSVAMTLSTMSVSVRAGDGNPPPAADQKKPSLLSL